MQNRFSNYYVMILLFISVFIEQACFAASNPISAQLQDKVNEYLKTYGQQEYISSVTLTVNSPQLKHAVTVFTGNTDMSHNIPVNASNLYQIGSITKSFVSVILLQLEAAPGSSFNINDKLGKYFPEYPQWADITVKQMLNMTSGIPSYTDDDQLLEEVSKNPYKRFQPAELIDYIKNKPLMFSPGTAWYYSNTSYILAGMLVQKLTGKTLEENMNERFFQTGNTSGLNLKNTYYLEDYAPFYPEPKNIYDRMVHGYLNNKEFTIFPLKTDVTNFSLSWAGAAGGGLATSIDVAQWAQALFTSATLLPVQQRNELESLVSTKTGQPISVLTPDERSAYGLGVAMVLPGLGEAAYFYTGETVGYRVTYVFFPKEKIVLSISLNSAVNDDEDNTGWLINQVYAILTSSVEKADVKQYTIKLQGNSLMK